MTQKDYFNTQQNKQHMDPRKIKKQKLKKKKHKGKKGK